MTPGIMDSQGSSRSRPRYACTRAREKKQNEACSVFQPICTSSPMSLCDVSNHGESQMWAQAI
eukprot:539236-Pelagomonas_calceolata.AAC.3